MNAAVIANSFPEDITSPLAWEAFQDVSQRSDWCLKVLSPVPLSFELRHDERFAMWLDDEGSWSLNRARVWIATRISQLVSDIDHTAVRRWNLQRPKAVDSALSDAVCADLKRRIEGIVRNELTVHFDTSVHEWERATHHELSLIDDASIRWRASAYLGFDQVVSVDAARKAIRFVIFRTHWHLKERGGQTVLVPDWRLEQLRSQRASLDERTRARSLVARCIETLIEDHAHEQRTGAPVAPMTRLRLKAEVERRFHEQGVWGLIELALRRDRRLRYFQRPKAVSERLGVLLKQQDVRMEDP
jgi:hypothetical protein